LDFLQHGELDEYERKRQVKGKGAERIGGVGGVRVAQGGH
jgi:hypothetical protein